MVDALLDAAAHWPAGIVVLLCPTRQRARRFSGKAVILLFNEATDQLKPASALCSILQKTTAHLNPSLFWHEEHVTY